MHALALLIMEAYQARIAASCSDKTEIRNYLDNLDDDSVSSNDESPTTQRPVKRRKISKQQEEARATFEELWKDAITLASLTIDLDYSEENVMLPSKSDVVPTSRQVYMRAPSSGPPFNRRKSDEMSYDYILIETEKPFKTISGLNLDPDTPVKAREILAQSCRVASSFNKSKFARCLYSLKRSYSSTGTVKYFVEIQMQWRDARNMGEYTRDHNSDNLLELLFPDNRPATPEKWSPRDFYESVFVPPKTGQDAVLASEITVEGLTSKLYPFQKRTVAWMLNREGVDLKGKLMQPAGPQSKHGFSCIKGLDGNPIYVNPWLGLVTSREYVVEGPHTEVRGGLIAEETGLGKTVETVSLILLHQREHSPVKEEPDDSLVKSGATLIVSPLSIQQQWLEEIQTHAPGLKVMIYEGVKSMKKADDEEMIKRVMGYDVVLCSYSVLSGEIHFSGSEPDRSLRHEKQYKKRKSPLVQIDWWRCVLDECQMVESGVSQAARVVNQIPRQNAWAVSGTPLRKDATDLLGLLVFLRIEPYWYSSQLFERLMSPRFRHIFKDLWRTIGLRHSKDSIKSELELPRQNRYVINMPFTQVEEQHYANLYQEMCDDCDLSLEGAPLTDEWDPNDAAIVEKMRMWLMRLRQTVLHAEVGTMNRRALGQSEGPLRTVAEVLKVMMEQNDVSMRQEERAWLSSKLRRGQILEHAKKPQEALDLWLEVVEVAITAVKECREDYQRAVEEEAAKPEEVSEDESSDSDEDTKNKHSRLGPLRMKLRGALEVLHTATFFEANGYYQIKTDEKLVEAESERFKELEQMETDTYEKAKIMRKEMLTETQLKANSFMTRISKRKLTAIPEFQELSTGGIESRHLLDKAALLTETMDEQAEKLKEWREAMIKLLMLPLIDQEETELQGDEYEASTKQQDEQYVYHEILRAAIADRSDFLTGQENGLIKRDMAIAMTLAKADQGPSPTLMIQLLEERQALMPRPSFGYLRGIVLELRGLKTDMERHSSSRANQEVAVISKALGSLQPDLTTQSKVVAELEKEIDLFRDAMNARLDFYRQLQAISDAVAPYEEEMDDAAMEAELRRLTKEEARAEAKMNTLKSRKRYLEHLKQESNSEDSPKKCIICQEFIEVGVLIVCGHQFCKDCLREWYNSHRTCPVCKRKLTRTDFHQITYKPQELTAQEETHVRSSQSGLDNISDGSASTSSLYKGINERTLAQIKNVDLPGSFGTKIDTLARHIIWLRSSDPGAKSIVFSQFRDFLDVLSRAFRRFKIGFTTIDDKKQGIDRFKKDSSVECLFLHAKAHSSGLNLVNATHVFLCEPLINVALELQAIARVHRIGQHHQTHVYMYLVEETVEKAIYDMSVKRRMAHITRAQQDSPKKSKRIAEDDIEKANAVEIQESSAVKMLTTGRGGGELVHKNDLWDCLFGVKAAGRAKLSDDAQRTIAGFLGAEAAEHRVLAQR